MAESEVKSLWRHYRMVAGSSAPRKVGGFRRSAEGIDRVLGTTTKVHSYDPQIKKPEINDKKAEVVALDKAKTTAEHFRPEFINSEEVSEAVDPLTFFVACDVLTFYYRKVGERIVGAKPLKRVLRKIPNKAQGGAARQWEYVENLLESEKAEMMKLCTNGVFYIEWHVGIALVSRDGKISNKAAVVIRAQFSPLHKAIIEQAFAVPKEVQEKKKRGERPDHALLKKIPAVVTGPKISFADLLQYPDIAHIEAVFNRDYKNEVVQLSPQECLQLIVDCELPPNLAMEMFAGAMDGRKAEDKPTVKLSLGQFGKYNKRAKASDYDKMPVEAGV